MRLFKFPLIFISIFLFIYLLIKRLIPIKALTDLTDKLNITLNPNQLDGLIFSLGKSSKYPIEFAKLLIAHARYETNDYTSNVLKNNLNLYGYKFVGQTKWVVGAGSSAPTKDAQGNLDGGVYAKYPSFDNSVKEILDWFERRKKEGKLNPQALTTPLAYAEALKKCGYYGQTAKQYSDGLKSKLTKITI